MVVANDGGFEEALTADSATVTGNTVLYTHSVDEKPDEVFVKPPVIYTLNAIQPVDDANLVIKDVLTKVISVQSRSNGPISVEVK